jgi:hypothetical protein
VESECTTCNGTGRVGTDGTIILSQKEMDKRRTLSRSLRMQVESMKLVDCSTCSGSGVSRVVAVPPPPKKRQYIKRSPRWSK